MGITGITDGNSISDWYQFYGAQSTTTPTDNGQPAAIDQNASSVSESLGISKMGQLLGKLQQLQQSDPEKFKQICASIASKLNEAAGNQGTGSEGILSKLASKFDQAAQTGDISSIMPQHKHHHRHGTAQAAVNQYSQNQNAHIGQIAQNAPGQSQQSDTVASIISSALEEAGISI